jgi:hypothetical protein
MSTKPKFIKVSQIDDDLPAEVLATPFRPWPEAGFQASHVLRTGAMLGCIGGCTSLLLNVVGSALWPAITGAPQHPLRLIQVFLTFPFGAVALQLDNGLTLALGCLLYLATGAAYGMIFELAVAYVLPHVGLFGRFVIFSLMALGLWIVNFYGILSWLQPLLFGGRWIMELIPWWVAAATHLVFGLTLALYPFGNAWPRRSIGASD